MVRAVLPAVIAACLAAAPSAAAADRRPFARTFGYATQDAGETELELASTQTRSSFADGSPQAFELGLAIEHGITDHTDVALVHVLAQTTGAGTPADPGAPLHLRDVTLRARHRLAERGELLADTTLVFEAAKLFGASVYRGDLRFVFARDVGIVTVALNPRVTAVIGDDVPTAQMELGWAAGVTVEVHAELHAGAESWGALDANTRDDLTAAAGPVLSWSPTPRLWVTAGAGFGLNARTEDVSVRALVGLLL